MSEQQPSPTQPASDEVVQPGQTIGGEGWKPVEGYHRATPSEVGVDIQPGTTAPPEA